MSDEEFGSWQKKLIATIIVAIVGGNVGFMLNKTTPEVRHDPFTGKQGRDLEHRIDRIHAEQTKMIWRMQQVEKKCAQCTIKQQDHFRMHP